MKDKKMSIRISEEDLQKVHSKAEKSGLSFTEYVTNCCLNKRIIVVDGIDEIIRQQKAIGKNLNQIAMLCNKGAITAPDLNSLIDEYSKLNDYIYRLLSQRK